MAETELPEISVNGTPKRRREEEQLLPTENNERPNQNPSNPEQEGNRILVNNNQEPSLVFGEGLPPPPVEAELPAAIPLEGIWMVAKNLTPEQKEALRQFKEQHNGIETVERGGGEILITGIEAAKLAAELALLLAKDTKVKLKDESQDHAVSEKIVYLSGALHHDENNNKLTVGLNDKTNSQKDLVKQALTAIEARNINEENNNIITATLERSKFLSLSGQAQQDQAPAPIAEALASDINTSTNLYSRSDVSSPVNAVSQNNVVFDINATPFNLDTLQTPIANQEPLQNMVVTSQIPVGNDIPGAVVVGANNLGQLNTLSINVSR